MTQELLLKECIQLQNKLYDFILNILNLPSFILNIQERLLRVEKENQELRQLLIKQNQAQNHTDNILSSLFAYDLEQNIFVAAKKGKLTALKYLIEDKGIDVNKQAEKNYDDEIIYKGDTALLVASKKDNFEVVQYLVEKGANIEAKNIDQWTPLHFASRKGSLPIVQYLIEKGANIEGKDNEQKTPLYISFERNNTTIVEYLIEKGARYDIQDYDKIRELLK